MTDDLVKRLRIGGETCGTDACKVKDARSGCLCAIAADRIERLEAALRKIAQHDLWAIAIDALRPGERVPLEGKDGG